MEARAGIRGKYQWCEKHWEPYRNREANGIAAQAFLLKSITDDERWLSMFDDLKDIDDDTARIAAAFDKVAPGCCWIRPERLEAILIVAKECNADSDASGAELAAAQVEAFKAWRENHRQDAN